MQLDPYLAHRAEDESGQHTREHRNHDDFQVDRGRGRGDSATAGWSIVTPHFLFDRRDYSTVYTYTQYGYRTVPGRVPGTKVMALFEHSNSLVAERSAKEAGQRGTVACTTETITGIWLCPVDDQA